MKKPNSFQTVAYKEGYIHTWITSTGRPKCQGQLGQLVKEHPTVIGCKRWVTKAMRDKPVQTL